MIEEVIRKVRGGTDLERSEMRSVVNQMMDGCWPPEPIGKLLLAVREKGESVDELVGAAQSLRAHMTRIRSEHAVWIDTCGTGGDGSGTFNISTAAAIVTAAAGIPVAKHGNRSITSKSGSSDVLQELGVNIGATVGQVEACLNRVGLCFCFAPLMHRSMKHVAEIRRKLGVPTIFNLLGPLCNPAAAPFQLLGVGRSELRPLMAQALRALGTERAVVVHGEDGLDEVTLSGVTHVSIASPDGIRQERWAPSDFGIARADLAELRVEGPAESAARIRGVLDGESGPPRDIVVMNAAAAIATVADREDLTAGAGRAAEAIDSGAAKQLLSRLVQVSHAPLD